MDFVLIYCILIRLAALCCSMHSVRTASQCGSAEKTHVQCAEPRSRTAQNGVTVQQPTTSSSSKQIFQMYVVYCQHLFEPTTRQRPRIVDSPLLLGQGDIHFLPKSRCPSILEAAETDPRKRCNMNAFKLYLTVVKINVYFTGFGVLSLIYSDNNIYY